MRVYVFDHITCSALWRLEMSWLKKPLALVLIVVALLASSPQESRAAGGNYSYAVYAYAYYSFVYASAGINYTYYSDYGYYGYLYSYYAYLYSYYGYYYDSSYNITTEELAYYGFTLCFAEYSYYSGSEYWYYAGVYDHYAYYYSYFSHEYE